MKRLARPENKLIVTVPLVVWIPIVVVEPQIVAIVFHIENPRIAITVGYV